MSERKNAAFQAPLEAEEYELVREATEVDERFQHYDFDSMTEQEIRHVNGILWRDAFPPLDFLRANQRYCWDH